MCLRCLESPWLPITGRIRERGGSDHLLECAAYGIDSRGVGRFLDVFYEFYENFGVGLARKFHMKKDTLYLKTLSTNSKMFYYQHIPNGILKAKISLQ